MAWKDTFIAMDAEARLQEITTISDLLRTLRRELLNVTAAAEKIEVSTQDYGEGWQGQLVTDMDTGDNTSYAGLEYYAEQLQDHFAE